MKSFMKRIVRLIAAPVALTVAAIPAQCLYLPIGSSCSLLDAVDAARMRSKAPRALSRADFVESKIDNKIVKAFERAWQRSGNGSSSFEGVVLILRMADGSFSGRDMGATNEYKRFTFPWHPAAVAIVHTHPNSSDPQPCDADIVAADKYDVPIFTITNRGMFVYDPGTRKISKVMNDLEWLDQSHWARTALALGKSQ